METAFRWGKKYRWERDSTQRSSVYHSRGHGGKFSLGMDVWTRSGHFVVGAAGVFHRRPRGIFAGKRISGSIRPVKTGRQSSTSSSRSDHAVPSVAWPFSKLLSAQSRLGTAASFAAKRHGCANQTISDCAGACGGVDADDRLQ